MPRAGPLAQKQRGRLSLTRTVSTRIATVLQHDPFLSSPLCPRISRLPARGKRGGGKAAFDRRSVRVGADASHVLYRECKEVERGG